MINVNSSQKEGTLLKSSHEVRIILIKIPINTSQKRKLQSNTYCEYDCKIRNKILTNHIQQWIKKKKTHTHTYTINGVSQECEVCQISKNQLV